MSKRAKYVVIIFVSEAISLETNESKLNKNVLFDKMLIDLAFILFISGSFLKFSLIGAKLQDCYTQKMFIN